MSEQEGAAPAPAAPASGMFAPVSSDTAAPGQPAPGQPGEQPQGDDFSQRFDALNNRDHSITQRERVVKGAESDLQALAKIKQAIQNGSLDPNDMVNLFGTEDVSSLLTQFVPADKRNTPKTAEEELRELKDLFLQDRETREQERFNSDLGRWESELTTVIQGAGDRFPYVNGLNAHGEVFAAWRKSAEETGQNPDWQQIAQDVEAQLIAQGERWSKILGGNPARQPPQQVPQTASRTLTNNLTPGGGQAGSSTGFDEMSDSDALAAAANMLVYK